MTSWPEKKKDTARGKTLKIGYSPLYESVGLISIKLSSPPFPVIRCMVSPSCVQASLNGPPIHQSVPSHTLFGPVSHAGTLGRPPSESSPRETPQLTDQGFLAGFPPSPTDPRLPHHLSPELGEVSYGGVASHHPPMAELARRSRR